MTLTDLALARLQEDLRQVHVAAREHEARLGTPPLELWVEQKEPSSHRSLNTGRTLARWRVSLESVGPLPIDAPVPEAGVDGMYWSFGRANFAVLQDGRVRIAWFVGPRYGRGFDCPVSVDADGNPVLGAGVLAWVS
jgi:hypothetical protein